MTTVIGSTSTTAGVIATKPVTLPVSPAASPSFSSVANSVAPATTTVDPTSGTVVTAYLNNSGDIQSQVPSSVALAYLRAGLTADGRSRHEQDRAAVSA